jgi:hypothetical protein
MKSIRLSPEYGVHVACVSHSQGFELQQIGDVMGPKKLVSDFGAHRRPHCKHDHNASGDEFDDPVSAAFHHWLAIAND